MAEFDSENINWDSVGSGASTFASGLGDLFYSQDRIDRQNEMLSAAEGDIEEFYRRYQAGEFDLSLDPKMLDFFKMRSRGIDTTPTLSAQATTLDTLSADPRALMASIPAVTQSTQKALADIEREEFGREAAIRQQEGQAYQGLLESNLDFARQIYGDKLASDQAAYGQAQQNIEALNQAQEEAWFNTIAGGLQVAGGIAGGFSGKDGVKIPKYNMGGDVMAQIMAAQQAGGEGGVPPRQDLPGPESHEANPIDMVAPNGEKVGEATGGEIILNSEQTEMIEGAVEAVDEAIKSGEQPSMEQLMDVYKAVSETLSQPQFQDGPGEGSKEDMMRARMEMMLGEQQVA
tara:strand:+ start:531 stop:1568 length:1038 start_codon:yes stop_codon:yes gene_type:complete